jgi:hypothetical protein
MWDISYSIKDAFPGLQTTRLSVQVTGVKPFVYSNEGFLQVASLPDMYKLPEDTGDVHRQGQIDLITRNKGFALDLLGSILSDLTKLETIMGTVVEVSYEVLYTNGPEESSESSESSG